jgi:hypothetical protein
LLIIENAHSMNPILFDLLTEFAELRARHKCAMRILLASDQPLSPVIRAMGPGSLSTRVTGQFLLQPLTPRETTNYLHRKLKAGGCNTPADVMPNSVCYRLHEASGGWPGKIDRMAVHTLANAQRCPVRVEDVPQRAGEEEHAARKPTILQAVPKRKPVKSKSLPAHLILTCNGHTLKRVALDKPRLTIGRNVLCDVQLDGDGVSKHHAILIRKDAKTILIDLNSHNGTRVNNRPVKSQVIINDDIIEIGEYRMKVVDPAAKKRGTLSGAGWDESTIAKSVRKLRNAIARQLSA